MTNWCDCRLYLYMLDRYKYCYQNLMKHSYHDVLPLCIAQQEPPPTLDKDLLWKQRWRSFSAKHKSHHRDSKIIKKIREGRKK